MDRVTENKKDERTQGFERVALDLALLAVNLSPNPGTIVVLGLGIVKRKATAPSLVTESALDGIFVVLLQLGVVFHFLFTVNKCMLVSTNRSK